MSPPPKEDYAEVPSAVGRRSVRLPISVPSIIRGVDTSGQKFKENTWTISVNKQGAKIATFHQLQIGDEITIENPILGRASKGHVVRVVERHFPEDPFEVGVELNEPQNVWGVKFPPDNWQQDGSASLGGRAVEGTPGTASPPRVPRAGLSATPQPVEAPRPTAAPPAPPQEAGEHAEGAAKAGLKAEAPSRGPAEPAQPSIAKPPDEAESGKSASVREAEGLLEEKESRLRSLRQEFDALSNSLRASQADLETVLARFQELQRNWQPELNRAQDQMQQFSREAIRSATAQAEVELRARMEEVSSHFIEETRKRLQAEAGAVIEASSQQASVRLAPLVEEYLSKTEPQLAARQAGAGAAAQAGEHIGQLLQTALAEFGEKLRKTADETAATLRPEMEKPLENLAAQLTAQVAQTFQEQAQGAAQTAEQSLQENLRKIQESVQEEIAGARAKAREICGQEIDAASKATAQNAEAMRESMRLAGEEGVKKMREAQAETQSWADDAALKFRKQAGELSTAALEGLKHYTEVQSQGLQTELQSAIARVQDKAVQDATERLEKTMDELMASSARLLQTQTDDSLKQAADKLKTLGKQSENEAKKQLAALAQSIRETLTREGSLLAEESRRQSRQAAQNADGMRESMRLAGEEGVKKIREVQAETQSWADDAALRFRKQAEELSTAALEGLQRYTEVQSQGLQTDLQAATARVQDKAVQDATERLQKTMHELMASAAQLLQTQTDDSLEQAADKLKTLGKQSEDEAEKQLAALAQSIRETLTREGSLLAEESRRQSRQAAQEVQAQSVRELEVHLQQEAEKQRPAYLKQFQQEVSESCERGVADMRSKVQRAAQEASEKVYKQVGVVAFMMKEWADQAKSSLDGCLQEAVESCRKQSADFYQEALEKHRQESAALLEDLRVRLQQAGRILEPTRPEQEKT